MRAEGSGKILFAVASLWLFGLTIGAREIYRHATDGGAEGATPARWPGASSLPPVSTGATAVMFLHPDCPCSRASVHELEAVLRRHPLGARVIAVFEGRGDGALWDAVGRTSSIIRAVDDGTESARFGARTSGFTVVYDASGALAFHGGITGSRGHVGDNMGRRVFGEALAGHAGGEHGVFGCALAEAR